MNQSYFRFISAVSCPSHVTLKCHLPFLNLPILVLQSLHMVSYIHLMIPQRHMKPLCELVF